MSMRPELETMVKSLVVVAWADGLMHREESAILDALITGFELDQADAELLRDFARTPRTLDHLPHDQLDDAARRTLLQHALLLTHADGEQSPPELATIHALARRLDVSESELAEIVQAADRRAKRLSALR